MKAKNFTLKLVAGLPIDEAEISVRLGDAAEVNTAGAKLARELAIAYLFLRTLPTQASKQRFEELTERLVAAVVNGDAGLLREVASFMDAAKRAAVGGPVAKGFSLAANYVMLCQSRETLPKDVLAELARIPSFATASRREPFTPSVREIADHLDQVMDPGPDYKTVERWARALGIKARPHTRKRKMDNKSRRTV